MGEEAAFLRAICDAPDEDTPRLVFADWLQERGNPFDTAWASLIRAQVRAVAAAGDERDAAREKATKIGTSFFRDRWLARLGLATTYSMWWGADWDRGFLNELRGPFEEVSGARRSLTHRVPFRVLDIGVRTRTQLKRVLTWGELRRLTSLSVYGHDWDADVGDDYAAELASCPALTGLLTLRLRYVTITDRGAADLLDSIPLRGVRELVLSWTDQPGATLSRVVRKRLIDRFGPHCLR